MSFLSKSPEKSRKRKIYTKTVLQNAIREIKDGASIRQTSIKYEIDRSTLRRYLLDEQKLQKLEEKNSQYKESQVFTVSEEKVLTEYLLSYSKMHYGLTTKQALKIAFEFAEVNSKKYPANWATNNAAGKDWFRGFRSRNPEVSLRAPKQCGSKEQTTLNQCTNSLPIPSTSNLEIVTPEMVRPCPEPPPIKMARRGRQPDKTKILTLAPEKENNSVCLSETLNTSSSNNDRFDDPKSPKRKKSYTDNENYSNKTRKKVLKEKIKSKSKQDSKQTTRRKGSRKGK